MTGAEARELIHNDQRYNFLSDPRLKHTILLGLGGSHAYGTNVEGSDVDIRGIALNSKEEILLGNGFDQVVNEETDTVIYSFKKIINLLTNCNPNTIELLGLKPFQYLSIDKIGQKLVDNKDMFLSRKCINSFGGYANQQLYRLNQICKRQMPQAELEKHILKTMEFMQSDFNTQYPTSPEDFIKLYIDDSDQEDLDSEIFMDVKLTHYPLRDYCGMCNALQSTARSYNKIGKRNDRAYEKGKITKHAMHLVRLYHMAFDILEKGEIITYREEDHDELMAIRNGKYFDEDNQPTSEFFEMVAEMEKRLEYDKANSDLPEQPDFKRINEFVMEVNESVVKGSNY